MSVLDIFKNLKYNQNTVQTAPEYIICGLGNPGLQYESTRHNVGFMTIDSLCEKHHFSCKKLKFKSLTEIATINGKSCLVMKPSTFMNNSGEAVVMAMQFYKIPPENVIVVFDDISLDVGKIRIRRKGSHGGQNGMKNIIYLSGSDNFPRIKIGIGDKPHKDYDLAKWVLSHFTKAEGELLEQAIEKAVLALELMVADNTTEAMNRYNA